MVTDPPVPAPMAVSGTVQPPPMPSPSNTRILTLYRGNARRQDLILIALRCGHDEVFWGRGYRRLRLCPATADDHTQRDRSPY
jgi:hypothetical protein